MNTSFFRTYFVERFVYRYVYRLYLYNISKSEYILQLPTTVFEKKKRNYTIFVIFLSAHLSKNEVTLRALCRY